MNIKKVKPEQTLFLGPVGSNGNVFAFHIIEDWSNTYGLGTYTILHKTPYNTEALLANIETDDEYLYWYISTNDTEFACNGKYQINYIVDDVVAKTIIGNTVISNSIELNYKSRA